MASVNKVILICTLGKDPEVRQTQSGSAICNLSAATSRKYKDAQGEYQEETEWHRISLFGRMAELAGQYLKKGSKFGRDWLGTYYQMCLVSPRPWKSAVVRYVCCSLRN